MSASDLRTGTKVWSRWSKRPLRGTVARVGDVVVTVETRSGRVYGVARENVSLVKSLLPAVRQRA